MKNYITILGINITIDSKGEILEKIEKYIKETTNDRQKIAKKLQKTLLIFTPNPEIVMFAQKDEKFKQIVNKAQINIPDGVGLLWAARVLRKTLKKRITGVDLAENLVQMAAKKGVPIGLIGGKPKIALKALECLKAKYPGLSGWAEEGPHIKYQRGKELQIDWRNWEIGEFVQKVEKADTKILLVGLGFPKQEYFSYQIASRMNNLVIMAVGGAFDFFSGRIPRAPKTMRSLGLEWLYRLYRQPQRLKRQLVIPGFILQVLKKRREANI